MTYRAFKTELNPTARQARVIREYCGVTRYVFNLYLATAEEHYRDTGDFLTGYEFSKTLNHSDRPDWLIAAPSKAVKQAIMNGDRAYRAFFKGRAGHPRFKRKNRGRDSFYYSSEGVHVQRHRLRLPKLGWVRLKEYGFIPVTGRVVNVTVSHEHDRYYASVLIDEGEPAQSVTPPTGEPLGVDVGVSNHATLSDGKKYSNVNKTRKVKKLLKRKRRLQRKAARQYRAGKTAGRDPHSYWSNYEDTKRSIRRVDWKLTSIRRASEDAIIHDVMGREPSRITIEDLNVRGLLRNHHLASALQAVRLGSLLRRLMEVAQARGIEVVIASRWYPSSKTCHECGAVNKNLRLGDREWDCPACHVLLDRDVNAALNLRDYDPSWTPSGSVSNI